MATADDVEAALRPKLEAHIGETWNPEEPLLHVRELFGTDWPESLTLEAYLSMEQAAEQEVAPRHAAWKRFSKHAGQQAFEPGLSRYFLPENVYFIDRLARDNNVSTLTSDIDGSDYSGPTGRGWVAGGRFKGLHQVLLTVATQRWR